VPKCTWAIEYIEKETYKQRNRINRTDLIWPGTNVTIENLEQLLKRFVATSPKGWR
jgi:hypothetical protein